MMTDERESQLSAMYDGELPAAERELVARRLSRDAALRGTWGNYALIGAVMRGETLASAEFAPKVAAAVAKLEASAEAAQAQTDDAVTPLEQAPRLPRWAVPASGLGLAAGIAVVGVFAVFWLGSQQPAPVAGASMVPLAKSRVAEVVIPAAPESVALPPGEALVAATATSPSADGAVEGASPSGEPLSYVTPSAEQVRTPAGPQQFNLASYVGAHSAVSAPMMRHSAISAIIAVEPEKTEMASEPAR